MPREADVARPGGHRHDRVQDAETGPNSGQARRPELLGEVRDPPAGGRLRALRDHGQRRDAP